MFISSLLLLPLIGIIGIFGTICLDTKSIFSKIIALTISIGNLIISLVIYILFEFSSNQFQFVQEHYNTSYLDIYLGIDGISIYFILLTTMIMPIALISNWNSITVNLNPYLIIMLLLETLLLAVFLVLDIFLFYTFFESILPPLFILIGLFGSSDKVRASFYFFLYTLFGSLFLLLSILTMSSIMGTTDFDALFKTNFKYTCQIFLFCGIFLAFAVKTPVYGLNTWLLKAHVESPLGGSVVLAAIVLKLSLYGVMRLILPILPKVSLNLTFIVYIIGVFTVIYASFSTIRSTDVKELIAYSSVGHASIYFMSVFSLSVQGIEGAILLGLAHGFVSSGLFICTGGSLYDRTGTRNISIYRGIAQMMPIFSILFFILCLANCGTPLTFNFIGEFLSLYGIIERLPIIGIFAASSIVLSAGYSIYLYNRICFGGSFSLYFEESINDLTKREFFILFSLVFFTVFFGIYPSFILDGIHYGVSNLIYSTFDFWGGGYNFMLSGGILPIFSIGTCGLSISVHLPTKVWLKFKVLQESVESYNNNSLFKDINWPFKDMKWPFNAFIECYCTNFFGSTNFNRYALLPSFNESCISPMPDFRLLSSGLSNCWTNFCPGFYDAHYVHHYTYQDIFHQTLTSLHSWIPYSHSYLILVGGILLFIYQIFYIILNNLIALISSTKAFINNLTGNKGKKRSFDAYSNQEASSAPNKKVFLPSNSNWGGQAAAGGGSSGAGGGDGQDPNQNRPSWKSSIKLTKKDIRALINWLKTLLRSLRDNLSASPLDILRLGRDTLSQLLSDYAKQGVSEGTSKRIVKGGWDKLWQIEVGPQGGRLTGDPQKSRDFFSKYGSKILGGGDLITISAILSDNHILEFQWINSLVFELIAFLIRLRENLGYINGHLYIVCDARKDGIITQGLSYIFNPNTYMTDVSGTSVDIWARLNELPYPSSITIGNEMAWCIDKVELLISTLETLLQIL